MPDLINNTLAFAAVCLIVAVGIAVAVWLVAFTQGSADQADPQQSSDEAIIKVVAVTWLPTIGLVPH